LYGKNTKLRVRFPTGEGISLFSTMPKPALDLHLLVSINTVGRILSLCVRNGVQNGVGLLPFTDAQCVQDAVLLY
jgi:hypothetical protein